MSALLLCLVVAITDGDSIKVRCGEEPVQAVRLAQVDAPEKGQAFGQRSKQSLAELCHERLAEVRRQTTDRYGRMVARVSCAGKDASAEQVKAGMAWAYLEYLNDPAIKNLERQARGQARGLWADSAPVAPWDWRKQRKG